MELIDRFGPEVARLYDLDDDVRFTAAHVAREAGVLAGVGGRALEFAIGTGRVALPLRDRGVGYDEFDHATQRMWSHHLSVGTDGRGVRRSVPLRYTWPAELDLMARMAGMRLVERWAWWDRSRFTADSTSHVSVWSTPVLT